MITSHVAPTGNDDAVGSADRPLLTPHAALARVRALRAAHPGAPARIFLAPGCYGLTETLLLDTRDSDLTIEGRDAILGGGRRITGWKPEGNGFWSAALPGVKEGKWDFRQLWVNGHARPRARLPECGFFEHESEFKQHWLSTTGGGFQPPPAIELRTTMVYRRGQLPESLSLKNAELIINHSWDESQARAVAHDPATRTLKLDPPLTYPPGAFGIQRYIVLNLREGMTKPGQWYLDREAGRVVYWPMPGEEPEECIIEAPAVMTLLRAEGTPEQPLRGLVLRNLAFDLTNVILQSPGWGAGPYAGSVEIENADGCRIEGLTVSRAGGQGLRLDGASNTIVADCVIHHCGANGIRFSGRPGNEIIDNLVHDVGLVYPSAVGIQTQQFRRSRIAHNEVHDTTYCGITAADWKGTEPCDNVIEYNLVWNTMTALGDGGPIYVTGERRTTFRGNVLHSSMGLDRHSMGLYLDEQTEDCLCEDNLVYNIGRHPLHLHMTKRNVIRNSIFVCGPGRSVSFARSSDCVVERCIFYAPETGIEVRDPGAARLGGNILYAGDKGVTDAVPPPGSAPGTVVPLAGEFLTVDPQFVNARAHDYRLQPNSPALKMGFKPFDPGRAGRLRPARPPTRPARPRVRIALGEPVVVSQAPPDVRRWGPWQFPGLQRLPDGRIQVSFHVEADSAAAYGLPPGRAVSSDEGRTWEPAARATGDAGGTEASWSTAPLLLPDGDRIVVRQMRSRKVEELRLPDRPFAFFWTYREQVAVYRLEDLPPECRAGWEIYRRRKGQAEWVREQTTVHLPGEARYVTGGVMPFPWFQHLCAAPDGAVWSVGHNRRVANGRFQAYDHFAILRSTDNGRTWDLWSELPYLPDFAADRKWHERDGFTEPEVGFMPDGSTLCLLRTTDGNGPGPMYWSRSTDNGRTWTLPAVFDDIGVWPQMLRLENGVTLAAYGRPGLYIRATRDPAGLAWDPRVAIVPPAPYGVGMETCSYASLLALGGDTALVAYSDFRYPDGHGVPRKTILTRTVHASTNKSIG